MIIRRMQESDLAQIESIYEKHYTSDFDYPDFRDIHYLPLYTVVGGDDRIISAGGCRSILESVMITDKDISKRNRREALLLMLETELYTARMGGYDSIHAWAYDEVWEKQLGKYGFQKTRGSALYLPTGL